MMKIEINNGIEEVWVPLLHKGFENTHEISNLGRVRCLSPTRKNKVVPYIVKTKVYRDNILIARLYNQDSSTMISIAYDVLKSFGFKKFESSTIEYKDGDRNNCNINNLYFVKKVHIPTKKNKDVVVKIKSTNKLKSCKKCIFYKCFKSQDDGMHFKIDYAKEGCFKYKEN